MTAKSIQAARDRAAAALRAMASHPDAIARLAALEEIGAIVAAAIENTEPEARIQSTVLGAST